LADFSSLNEVRHLAHDFKRQYERLDVLVNNAGAWFLGRKLTDEDIEMTFMVNHLAPFLLTNLLLDPLKKSSPSRIVNVTSDTHRGADIEFDRLRGEDAVSGYAAYRQSKLANVLFTYELAKRLEGTDVTVNCLHPGAVRTRLLRDNMLLNVFWRWSPFFKSAEEAAGSVVRLATSPDLDGVTGKYFSEGKERRSSPQSCDSEVQKRLWQVSEKMTSLKD
jgi:NAD(P)-dependent dehydrogenase (short-subunit alcohol dehydrogenase family)